MLQHLRLAWHLDPVLTLITRYRTGGKVVWGKYVSTWSTLKAAAWLTICLVVYRLRFVPCSPTGKPSSRATDLR
jgi:hypothetical protein